MLALISRARRIHRAASVAALVLLAAASQARADSAVIQWTAGTGANSHYYQRIDQTNLTFDQAKAAAAAKSSNGLPGHLAIFETNNYANEFTFVRDDVYAPSNTSNRIYWAGASRPQSNNSGNLDWTWVDNTPVPTSITNTWNIDFAEGNIPEGIAYFQPASAQLWDYDKNNASGFVSGYVVEFEPVPEPATLALLSLPLSLSLLRRRRHRNQLVSADIR
jgi:hypothetical protein